MEKNQKGFVQVLLIVIVLVVGLGVVGYFVYQSSQWEKEPVKQAALIPTTTEQLSDELTYEQDLTLDWKTYRNNFVGFSINHPQDWEVSLVTNEEPFRTSNLTVSRSEYKLQFSTTTAGYGGIICEFSDSTSDQFAGPGKDLLNDYYDLGKLMNKDARRNKDAITSLSQYGYQRTELDYTFRACIELERASGFSDNKKAYEGTFDINGNILEIVYYTPRTNIDNNNLKIMDQILSTFQFLE